MVEGGGGCGEKDRLIYDDYYDYEGSGKQSRFIVFT